MFSLTHFGCFDCSQFLITVVEYKSMGSNLNNRENVLLDSMEKNHSPKVDLNDLMRKVKDEEKKSKRQNIVISAAALSAVAVFGIILTL